MSVLNIYIDDFIGIDPSTQTKGVTLQSVVAQITSYKEDYTTIKVNLIDVSKIAIKRGIDTITNNLDRMVKKEKITTADKTATKVEFAKARIVTAWRKMTSAKLSNVMVSCVSGTP